MCDTQNCYIEINTCLRLEGGIKCIRRRFLWVYNCGYQRTILSCIGYKMQLGHKHGLWRKICTSIAGFIHPIIEKRVESRRGECLPSELSKWCYILVVLSFKIKNISLRYFYLFIHLIHIIHFTLSQYQSMVKVQ